MSETINRWRRGELDLILAGLQLGCFAGAVLLMVECALLYRYFTDAALEPMWSFLASLKIAAPPVIVLAVSYLYAFVTGDSVADAPKSMWALLRDHALQHKITMTLFVAIAILFSTTVMVIYATKSPPSYERIVAQLLGGENDDQQIVAESIKELREKNPEFSNELDIVRRVFEERRLWNHENKQVNATLPRIFIRSLEANISDKSWRDHPLRWHAAAEAHAMLAQALASQHGISASTTAEKNRDEAIDLYKKVIGSSSVLVTPLMRLSAEQNIGNTYYYAGNFKRALDTYTHLSEKAQSLGIDANRVAALVQLGRAPEAVEFGSRAMQESKGGLDFLTEIREYVSLATNTGFTKLILGETHGARSDLQEAFDLLPDSMARQNLALAIDAAGEPNVALTLLAEDTDAPIVTADSEFDVVAKRGGGNCTYLIRAAALSHNKSDPAEVAANLAAYSRQAQPKDKLASNHDIWQKVALKALRDDVRPCGNLLLLPTIQSALN